MFWLTSNVYIKQLYKRPDYRGDYGSTHHLVGEAETRDDVNIHDVLYEGITGISAHSLQPAGEFL